MTNTPEDDTHTTLGRRFRTPAHPEVLAALGRALFCFLGLEETVSAILYEAGAEPLPITRGKMAGDKEKALGALATRYREFSRGLEIAATLDVAVVAFRQARESIRNEVMHAHPFTAGADSDGVYLPGLAYTAKDGKSWKIVARTPEDLLDLAASIENAIEPLDAARNLVRSTPLAKLE